MKNELIKHDTSDRMVALLADKLRTRILSGEFQPDDRLPNWEELSKMFDVSKVTVSKAIKELQEDGFVYSKVKLGTFVCSVLPQTRRYGLIINEHKHSVRKTWSLAQIALRDAARHLTRTGNIELLTYDLPDDMTASSRGDYDRLVRELQHGTLGGLIFSYIKSPELREQIERSKIPYVRTYAGKFDAEPDSSWRDSVCNVIYDHDELIMMAAEHVHSAGLETVAVIDFQGNKDGLPELLTQRFGLQSRREWCLNTANDFEQAGMFVQLFFNAPAGDWPEAIIIGDDHLTESVSRSVGALDIPQERKPLLISYCNYPVLPKIHHPVTFLGLNAYTFRGAALDALMGKIQISPDKKIIIHHEFFSNAQINKTRQNAVNY